MILSQRTVELKQKNNNYVAREDECAISKDKNTCSQSKRIYNAPVKAEKSLQAAVTKQHVSVAITSTILFQF
ncbi:hypothetical protein Hanom_Chr16g01424461 [Helianthus anomalus]